jgi:hypothetical protein
MSETLDGSMNTPQMSLERFYLIRGDLRDAQKFADYILTRGLHEKKGDKTQLIHRAFNLSMIVSYCRPFTRNREYTEREIADSPIYDFAWRVLGQERFALHKEIVHQRNNIYAHSPAGNRFIARPTRDRVAFQFDVFAPLPHAQTVMLRSIIKTWLKYLEPLKSTFS